MSGDNFSPQGTTNRQRKDGGIRCAAWGCGKSKLKDNIGVFEFPDRERSTDRFRFWCSLVSRTRKDFRFSKGTSRLCADHFDSDQIENWMRIKLMKEEDPVAARKIHWRLIPHARPNPSLFPRPVHGSTPQPKQPPSIGNSVEPTRRRPWPGETTSGDMEITKRPRRGAAAIRERKRLVEDAQTDMAQKDLEMMAQQDAISDMMDIDVREVAEGHGQETGKSKVTHRDIHIQMNRRPTHRSTRVQVCPKTFSQDNLRPPEYVLVLVISTFKDILVLELQTVKGNGAVYQSNNLDLLNNYPNGGGSESGGPDRLLAECGFRQPKMVYNYSIRVTCTAMKLFRNDETRP
ncbi:uncharacterized protein LOC134783016 [Penaeus indicus]|uniref:uncharacterized protein LOC134783016 n=1 Tax=Penaeus indicus TaxID=29960 RepID=UPI00300CF324